jgi:hypothetical protein
MRKTTTLLILAVILLSPRHAWGDWFRRGRAVVSYYYPTYSPVVSYYYPAYSPVVMYYYYPPPVYVSPAVEACASTVQNPVALPSYMPRSTQEPPLNSDYAAPTIAPPSQPKKSQSLSSPAGELNESRSYYDAYPVAPRDPPRPIGTRCDVGFWNLTDRDLTLRVDGQAVVLAQGKSLPLNLGREFVWQIEGRDPERQTLRTDESGLEIVIRR